MKLLVSALIAIGCIGAQAATNKTTKHKIKFVRAGEVVKKDVTHTYVGPIAVSRISVNSWKVELLAMTVPDPTAMPARNVKAVLDISPTDPMDPDTVEEAFEMVSFFFNVKTGFNKEFYPSLPVAKVVTIAYDPADVVQDNTYCLGLDLEVFYQGSTTVKNCYRVRPIEIIEHGL